MRCNTSMSDKRGPTTSLCILGLAGFPIAVTAVPESTDLVAPSARVPGRGLE